MVKNYLIVVGIIWLILHSALSWGMPDAWVGVVVLGQSVAFALLNRGNEAVAGASFAPLTAMALWGGVDETVMRVFFRCLSEGDAHGLAVLLTVTFSIMQSPSLLLLSRVLTSLQGKCLVLAVFALSFAIGSCMVDCAVIICVAVFLMMLSVSIRDVRGLACIASCGIMIAMLGYYSSTTSLYLVARCMTPRYQGWIYATWALCSCAAFILLWRWRRSGTP